MLKSLSRKIAFQWIILCALLAYATYIIISQAQPAGNEGVPFLFKHFANSFPKYELMGKGIILTVLISQILLLQYYYKKNNYSPKTSLMPACFYLSILLLTKSLTVISPFFFTLLFFLIIISIDFTVGSEKLKSNVLWVGFLIAFATCFDISSIVLFFLVLATLIINQFSRIKEVGILLLGFLLLYLYFFSYYFFTNNLNEWVLTFQQLKFMGVLFSQLPHPNLTLISLICLGIIYLFLIVKFKLLSDSKVALQRNRIVTLNTRAILMIACIFISNSTYPAVLGYLFVHISIYLAMLAQEKSRLYINEWITIIILVALCL